MDDMEYLLLKLSHTANDYHARVSELKQEVSRIRQLPCFDGKAIYKDTHYLVLVPRMINGERKLRYIGRDPVKIEQALKAVERGDRLRIIESEINDLERAADQFLSQLRQAATTLSPKEICKEIPL